MIWNQQWVIDCEVDQASFVDAKWDFINIVNLYEPHHEFSYRPMQMHLLTHYYANSVVRVIFDSPWIEFVFSDLIIIWEQSTTEKNLDELLVLPGSSSVDFYSNHL